MVRYGSMNLELTSRSHCKLKGSQLAIRSTSKLIVIHHSRKRTHQVLRETRIPSRDRSARAQISSHAVQRCWGGLEYGLVLPSAVRAKF